MEKLRLELPVVGVRFLDSLDGLQGVPRYVGVSYCDAVRRATFGEELILTPGCIEVCKWSPIILGLKEPASRFELGLEPRLEKKAGVLVAQLSSFTGTDPDVVIVRGRRADLQRILQEAGEGGAQTRYRGQIGRTALGDEGISSRAILTAATNRVLARLRRWKRFDDLTRTAFRNQKITGAFEGLAKNAVADMSVCRNSSVLPFLEGAGNVSFFCAGGVTWGGNSARDMTSGWPYEVYLRFADSLDSPGKRPK